MKKEDKIKLECLEDELRFLNSLYFSGHIPSRVKKIKSRQEVVKQRIREINGNEKWI